MEHPAYPTRTRRALPPGRAPARAAGRHESRTARRTASRPESDSSRLGAALCGALLALPISALIGLLLLLGAAWIANATPDPDRLIAPLGLAALGLTVFCGGLITSRRAGRAPLLCGLLFGGVAVLALFAGSLAFGDASRQTLSMGISAGARAGLYAALVGVSTLGAGLGRRR